MLAANLCAADYLLRERQPTLFRVHLGPTPEKLAALKEFLAACALSLGGGDDPAPRMLAAQLCHTVHLLDVAPVGSGEMAVEPVPIPSDSGAESLRKPKGSPDCRNVQVGTRGEQHQEIAGAAVALEHRERIGVHPAGEQPRHEFIRQRLDLLPGTLPEYRADVR